MTTLAPSCAAPSPIAGPMPRDPPGPNNRLPLTLIPRSPGLLERILVSNAGPATVPMSAARADRLACWPGRARAGGALALPARSADPTEAYQGAGGGLGPADIATLRRVTVGDAMPDLTFVFDLPAETGLARAEARGG